MLRAADTKQISLNVLNLSKTLYHTRAQQVYVIYGPFSQKGTNNGKDILKI